MILIDLNILPINKSDLTELALLMSWRSNPDIYGFFLQQKSPLIWENHYFFITESKNRMDFIIYLQKRPVGHIALSDLESEFPEVSIMLGETTLWGKGLSNIILRKFLQLQISNGYSKFSAKISNSNISSIKLFQKNGFNYSRPLEINLDWGLYLFHNTIEGDT